MPSADKQFAKKAACYARSQLGYILGDTGRSYVVGVGNNYPQQVRTAAAGCKLARLPACARPGASASREQSVSTRFAQS